MQAHYAQATSKLIRGAIRARHRGGVTGVTNFAGLLSSIDLCSWVISGLMQWWQANIILCESEGRGAAGT